MSRLARVGALILGALILLSMAIFIIGDKQFVFSRTYQVVAPFDNVAGLHNGAEVRIGGVRKGTVNHLRMPERAGEKVVVVVDLESSTRGVVKKDSVASIETEGLLGNKYLTISFGSPEAEPVRDGDTIGSRPPVDFNDLVKKTNEIMDTTNAAMKNVEEATADFKSITAKVNQGQGTVGALINDRTVYNQVSAASADVRDTVAQAKVGVSAFNENMQALKQNWFFRGFFKDRGYQDATELTKNEVAKLPEGQPLKNFVYNGADIFDKDTAKLKNEKSLNQVGEFLEKTPFGMVVVAAYTGLTGRKDENLILTQARAMVVRNYLAEKFRIDDSRLKTKGMGEDQASDPAKANRLEILVYPDGSEQKERAQNAKARGN